MPTDTYHSNNRPPIGIRSQRLSIDLKPKVPPGVQGVASISKEFRRAFRVFSPGRIAKFAILRRELLHRQRLRAISEPTQRDSTINREEEFPLRMLGEE